MALEWADVVEDLAGLHETPVKIGGQELIRSEAEGTVGRVFQARGAAVPTRPFVAPERMVGARRQASDGSASRGRVVPCFPAVGLPAPLLCIR